MQRLTTVKGLRVDVDVLALGYLQPAFDIDRECFDEESHSRVSDFESFVMGDQYICTVAFVRRRIVAFSIFDTQPACYPNYYWVNKIAVYPEPELRRKGIGTLLIEQVIEMAQGNQKKGVFLSVSRDNNSGRSFAQQQGFDGPRPLKLNKTEVNLFTYHIKQLKQPDAPNIESRRTSATLNRIAEYF